MAITVGDIYTAFPNFRPEDMIKLCNGNKNLNGRTVVPLANIAAYDDMNLSVFVAGREGKNYTKLLTTKVREEVNETVGVKDNEEPKNDTKNQKSKNVIPRDTSIFEVANNIESHDVQDNS